MKKLLLFIFALFLWTGAWAQTDLSLGKHVYPAGPSVEGVTEDALQRITNGNEDDEVNISKWDSPNLTAQSFYVDLGETKEIGSVKIIWQGAAAHAYKIYAATEKVGDAEPTWGETEIGSQTDVARWNTSKIELTNEFDPSVNARYIKIEITDPSGGMAPDWGVKIREMKVLSPFVAQVSTLLFSNYIAKANAGLGLSIDLKDQIGNTYNGDVTFTISPVVSNANIHNDTKYIEFPGDIAAGTYTITATDANSNTASQKIVFVSEAAPNPTANNSNVHGIYSETYNATSPTSDPTWNWKYTSCNQLELASGNKCYLVHNVGTFGLNNEAFDVRGYKYLHFDIYAVENVNGYVTVESSDITNKAFSLTGGQWNSVKVDLSSCTNLNAPTWIQLYIGNSSSDNQRDVLIDNVYFEKEAEVIDPSTIERVTVTAASTSIAEGKTTQLTVTDQLYRDVTSLMTFGSSNTSVATVDATGLVTALAKGSATITATVEGNAEVFNTVEITVTEAELGFDLTEGNHTIHVTPYHYVGTNNYKLVITSEDVMTGMGGSFWYINGAGKDMRANDETQKFIVTDNKITITTTSTSAPKLYTPLYVIFNGVGQITYSSLENQKLPWIEAQEVNITSYKWASFSSSNALDFGKVEGLTAYIATDNNGKELEYNTVNKVPASTGLLLNADEGIYDVPVIASAPALVGNLLKEAVSEKVISAGDAKTGKFYAFGRIGTEVGFIKMADTGYTVHAGKAYLKLTDALSKGLDFIGLPGAEERETDGINKVNTLVETGVRYNLAGQRVSNDYKGIVVVNGKKYLRK